MAEEYPEYLLPRDIIQMHETFWRVQTLAESPIWIRQCESVGEVVARATIAHFLSWLNENGLKAKSNLTNSDVYGLAEHRLKEMARDIVS